MNCPECGEALQPGVRVCPNCEYELTEAEFAQNSAAPAAPEKPSVSAPSRPATTAPANPVKPTKPTAPAAPDVSMPESIMAHGDVSVASNQHDDHSVHTTQNTTHNTQNNVANNTTNNTQQTIIINVGAGGQLPGGIVDEQTTRAVNEVAAQQTQQQPRKPKPQQQPKQEDVPTFSDKPQKDEKGVGSITGEGTIYVQTGRKMPAWLIILIVAAVIIIAGVLLFSGKKASPEPEGPAATETVSKPAATKPAATKPAATKPAATTTTAPAATAPAATTAPAETPASTSGTTATTRPATTTSRAIADPYEDGMNAYRSGDYDKAVEQLNKAAQSAEKKKAADAAYKLGLMYETGDGVPADKQQAIEYYRKAAKLGSKEAKRKLM